MCIKSKIIAVFAIYTRHGPSWQYNDTITIISNYDYYLLSYHNAISIITIIIIQHYYNIDKSILYTTSACMCKCKRNPWFLLFPLHSHYKRQWCTALVKITFFKYFPYDSNITYSISPTCRKGSNNSKNFYSFKNILRNHSWKFHAVSYFYEKLE